MCPGPGGWIRSSVVGRHVSTPAVGMDSYFQRTFARLLPPVQCTLVSMEMEAACGVWAGLGACSQLNRGHLEDTEVLSPGT